MAQRRGNNWAREWERQQAVARREQLRQERKRQERERQQAYVAQQTQLAADRTTAVEHEAEQLGRLLRHAVVADPLVSFDGLRRVHRPQRFDEGHWSGPGPAPRWEDFAPPEPGALSALFGGRRRYEERLAQEEERFGKAQARHERAEAEHRAMVQKKKRAHQAAQENEARAVREFNDGLEQRRAAYRAGEPENGDAPCGVGRWWSASKDLPRTPPTTHPRSGSRSPMRRRKHNGWLRHWRKSTPMSSWSPVTTPRLLPPRWVTP
ncbi:hypothetical protein AB5L52_10910 [Streptomyces sp. CG4]|uniref:hypothetical protein n=1 Tax=Streptomyces sp. CG4 TaxID=408783 RepID=UPI0034E21EFF